MTKRQNNSGSIYFEKARKRFRASFVAPNGQRVTKRFTTKEELIQSIQDYIEYYNNRRLQRKLHIMTPMAFHELTLKAA